MMKRETSAIADIHVPIKRRATLEQQCVDEIAGSMLHEGQRTTILVRADCVRFVLVEGHRLSCLRPETLNGRAPLSRRSFKP
jgi:sulfiredoxin